MKKQLEPSVYTVAELKAALEGVPGSRGIMTQVVGQDYGSGAWNMHLSVAPSKLDMFLLTVWHPDLDRLPAFGEKPVGQDDRSIYIDYKNYKGERSMRKVTPTGKLEFKRTEYHPEPQWIMEAWCHERQAIREFAVLDIFHTGRTPNEALNHDPRNTHGPQT